jgi:hypothetical protein
MSLHDWLRLTSYWLAKAGVDYQCQTQRGLNTKRPTVVFFLGPTTPLPHHMIMQARTGDTALVKRREMTGRTQTLPWWLGGRRGKDDRKQNTFSGPDPARQTKGPNKVCVFLKKVFSLCTLYVISRECHTENKTGSENFKHTIIRSNLCQECQN